MEEELIKVCSLADTSVIKEGARLLRYYFEGDFGESVI